MQKKRLELFFETFSFTDRKKCGLNSFYSSKSSFVSVHGHYLPSWWRLLSFLQACIKTTLSKIKTKNFCLGGYRVRQILKLGNLIYGDAKGWGFCWLAWNHKTHYFNCLAHVSYIFLISSFKIISKFWRLKETFNVECFKLVIYHLPNQICIRTFITNFKLGKCCSTTLASKIRSIWCSNFISYSFVQRFVRFWYMLKACGSKNYHRQCYGGKTISILVQLISIE